MSIFNQALKKNNENCDCKTFTKTITENNIASHISVSEPSEIDSELEDGFFRRAYTSLCKMQEEKDKRYGNSALKPLDIFAKHHSYGTRIDEKLARIKHSDKLRKNDVADIIGGLMLLCKEKNWDYFEDLID
jgi:hypothetical protein